MTLDTELRIAHLEEDVAKVRKELEVSQNAIDLFTSGYATQTLHAMVLRKAAQDLIDRIEFIHADPAYKAVWVMHDAHGGRYTGPKYVDELATLKQALADPDSLLPKAV